MTKRSLLLLVFAGLVALFWFRTNETKPGGVADSMPVRQDRMGDPGAVFAMSTPIPSQASTSTVAAKSVITAAPAVRLSSPEPPPLPFAFLGKITEAGRTSLVLYGGGRTLKVQDVGRLDDNYEVDAILDDAVVLRYVPLGTRQILELGRRQFLVGPVDSDAYPQD